MGDNVRELTPIEKENAALKDRIDELEKELEKQKEAARCADMWYHMEQKKANTLRGKVAEMREAIVAQALCMRDCLDNDDRL